MKPCFGYIRVSTQKQGEGVSLEAQKEAILAFASRNNLTITRWFEEKETAAKRGRPVFNSMLTQLKQGRASGLVMHKIDRSARNLRDWALISELPRYNVKPYFAADGLDFETRSGRLSANLQAVIAEDYIFNLREETIKGMKGRLKQGLYPWAAPPGYLDQGGGKPKIPCPKAAPLIKLAFELYATRQHSYVSLLEELHNRGLRNTRGGKLTLCGLGNILQNPFYVGIIYVKSSGQSFDGIHEPIISPAIWKQVQLVRKSRSGPKITRHNHLFQGLFRCGLCGLPMVPELQKANVYYRCKGSGCPTKTIRQDRLQENIEVELRRLTLSAKAERRLQRLDKKPLGTEIDQRREAVTLRVNDTKRRLGRLEDLLLDEVIEPDTYKSKKNSLSLDLLSLEEELRMLPDEAKLVACQTKMAELRNSLCLLYEMANDPEKREIIENVWPNRSVIGKRVVLEPNSWVQRAEIDPALLGGTPARDTNRTFIVLVDMMERMLRKNDGV